MYTILKRPFIGMSARWCRSAARDHSRSTPLRPRAYGVLRRSMIDVVVEFQAEHGVDERECLELRARRNVLAGLHVAKQRRCQVIGKGVADRAGGLHAYRPGDSPAQSTAPLVGRLGGIGRCSLGLTGR